MIRNTIWTTNPGSAAKALLRVLLSTEGQRWFPLQKSLLTTPKRWQNILTIGLIFKNLDKFTNIHVFFQIILDFPFIHCHVEIKITLFTGCILNVTLSFCPRGSFNLIQYMIHNYQVRCTLFQQYYFLKIVFDSTFYVCVYVCELTHAITCIWRSEDS